MLPVSGSDLILADLPLLEPSCAPWSPGFQLSSHGWRSGVPALHSLGPAHSTVAILLSVWAPWLSRKGPHYVELPVARESLTIPLLDQTGPLQMSKKNTQSKTRAFRGSSACGTHMLTFPSLLLGLLLPRPKHRGCAATVGKWSHLRDEALWNPAPSELVREKRNGANPSSRPFPSSQILFAKSHFSCKKGCKLP